MTDTSGAFDLSATVAAANGKDPIAGLRGLVQQDQKILDAKAKDPKITKDQDAVSDAAEKGTKDVHAAYDGIEKLGDRLKPWDAQKEMSDRTTNPLQSFGSFGSILALAASAFTRTPAINAMNGMAAAVNAVKANDEEKYKKAYDAWKENYQLSLERHKAQHEDYEDAMQMADHDINGAKAKLLADSAKYDDAHLRNALEMDDLSKFSQIQNARDASARGWAGLKPEIEAFHEHMDTMFAAQKELLPAYLKTPAGQQFLAQNPKFDPNNPDMKKMPKDFIGAAALLTTQKEAAAKRAGGLTSMSQQESEAVNDLVATGMSREDAIAKVAKAAKPAGAPRSAPAMATQKFMEEHPDATSADIQKFAAQGVGRSAAQRSLEAGPMGNQLQSLSVATDHLYTLKELNDAFAGGDVQRIAQAKAAWEREFGNPAPSNMDVAAQFVAPELIKAIEGTPGGVVERDKLTRAFEAERGHSNVSGAIDTAFALMGGQLNGLRHRVVNVDKLVGEDEFNDMVSSAALDAMKKHKTAVPDAAATKHEIGDVVTSPDGVKHKITGFDTDGTPLGEVVQ